MALRIGVIGCGGMAVKGHGPALEQYHLEHPGVTLAACCDVEEERAKVFAKKFGFIRSYGDPGKMIAAESLDAICLYVPPANTASLAIEILEAGISVLLEKPPGVSVEECRRISDAHLASGKGCTVAFNRRFMPLIREAKKITDSFQILSISCTFLRNNRVEEEFQFTAIHGLDTVRFIGGRDYSALRIDTIDLSARGAGIRAYGCFGSLDNGVNIKFLFNQVAGVQRERIEVFGLDRTLSADLPVPGSPFYPGRLTVFGNDRQPLTINGATLAAPDDYPETSGFAAETREFLDAIRTGSPPPGPTPAEALQSLEVANALNDGVNYRPS